MRILFVLLTGIILGLYTAFTFKPPSGHFTALTIGFILGAVGYILSSVVKVYALRRAYEKRRQGDAD